MRYLPRPRELEAVRSKLRRVPVTALLGPRQCDKTTLAQSLKAEHFFDLKDPRSLVRLDEPQTALEGLTGTVVIDEVQRKPDLFPLLRVPADRQQAVRYLLLGSASPDLVKEVSESLAGRVAYHDLGPDRDVERGDRLVADQEARPRDRGAVAAWSGTIAIQALRRWSRRGGRRPGAPGKRAAWDDPGCTARWRNGSAGGRRSPTAD